MFLIEARSLSKDINGSPLFHNVNFQIKPKTSISIVGKSGSGKTTLLKILAMIIKPEHGNLFYFNKHINNYTPKEKTKLRTNMGVVFQNSALLDFMTSLENILFYFYYHKIQVTKKIMSDVNLILEQLNLAEHRHKSTSILSGGMKKRIAIARALIHKPKILLMDEPERGLDPINTDNMAKTLKEIQKSMDMTLISVNSDMQCANKLSETIMFISNKTISSICSTKDFFSNPSKEAQNFLK